MTQLNNSVLWSETLLVNLMANFWWSTWCLVFTFVFHCCLCHVGPQLKKHSSRGLGRICNSKSGPGRIWKNHIRCNPTYSTVCVLVDAAVWHCAVTDTDTRLHQDITSDDVLRRKPITWCWLEHDSEMTPSLLYCKFTFVPQHISITVFPYCFCSLFFVRPPDVWRRP